MPATKNSVLKIPSCRACCTRAVEPAFRRGSTPASGVAGRASRPAFCARGGRERLKLPGAPAVFREGAENGTRGACAPPIPVSEFGLRGLEMALAVRSTAPATRGRRERYRAGVNWWTAPYSKLIQSISTLSLLFCVITRSWMPVGTRANLELATSQSDVSPTLTFASTGPSGLSRWI